jgi:hypothetical protein
MYNFLVGSFQSAVTNVFDTQIPQFQYFIIEKAAQPKGCAAFFHKNAAIIILGIFFADTMK